MSVHHKGVQDTLSFEVREHVVPPDATHCLHCTYHNFIGLSQQDIRGKVEGVVVPLVNGILAPMGWQYISVGVYGNYFEIYYKEASPAIVVTAGVIIAILALVTACILGICITLIKWFDMLKEKELTQAKVDKKELLEEGKISQEQYTELIKAQEEEEKDMWGGLMGMLPLILIFIILMAITGAVGRRRE